MTAVADYLQDLDHRLRVRGRARNRFLHECRDHLLDASTTYGEHEAIRRFGPAEHVADEFDLDMVDKRSVHSAVMAVIAVLALGVSTVALINAADPHASAVPVWAVIFFGAAQAAGVSVVLAVVQLSAQRRREASPSDVALLARRSSWGLLFALLTLVAGAGAVPGHGAGLPVLVGVSLAMLAAILMIRTRMLLRRFGDGHRLVRSPLADLGMALGKRVVDPSPAGLLLTTVAVAVMAAFVWDQLDFGTLASSLTAAVVEAVLIVLGFLVLGPSLGLRASRRMNGESS